ncbi:MAG: outer membrane beta-barrel protein [Bacteroidetes bacterium]|nr:outer membrane beta-barrel protein [Bacteroidota bacterium]
MSRIISVFLFTIPSLLQGQSFFSVRQDRSLILTAGTGTCTYLGDLTNPGTIIKLQPNFNVGLQLFVSPRVSVRTELNWFVMQGSDNIASEASRKLRGLSFHSSCFEISATGEVNLFANGNRYYRRPTFNVYGFAGVGVLYFNPKADYNGQSYSLEPMHTEGVSYSRVVPVIPFGLGVRLKMTPNLNLAIEGGLRKTFTDYLDDVSNRYVATSSDPIVAHFQNPNSAVNNFKPGSKRGSPDYKDAYFLLNAKIEYYLPLNSLYSKRPGSRMKKKGSMFRYNKRGGVKRR